ncbi:hypothetical protein JHK82_027482 [Glycine max]|nr:hypothetical protein JHK82_027482 [Glycine max]
MPSGTILLLRKLISMDMKIMHYQSKIVIVIELRRLRKLSHENVMKPIGYVICSGVALLIHQYLPNEHWLNFFMNLQCYLEFSLTGLLDYHNDKSKVQSQIGFERSMVFKSINLKMSENENTQNLDIGAELEGVVLAISIAHSKGWGKLWLEDDIQQKRQKKLAKTIANEDKALETFGLATKVKRILREQKGKVQTKKPAQQQKERVQHTRITLAYVSLMEWACTEDAIRG